MIMGCLLGASGATAAAPGLDSVSLLQSSQLPDVGKAVAGIPIVGDALSPKSSNCPWQEVTAVADLNLTEYTRASWFVQEQQEVPYQKESQLRCVVATYDMDGTSGKVPGHAGEVLNVYNYYLGGYRTALKDTHDQPVAASLCATDTEEGGKLKVAPCFLPQALAGDYWVIMVGTLPDGRYEWAVISGGTPKEQYPDGCTTGTTDQNNAGLWIFARKKVLSQDKLKEIKAALTGKGYTLRLLKPVKQGKQWCSDYPGAYIKKDTEEYDE